MKLRRLSAAQGGRRNDGILRMSADLVLLRVDATTWATSSSRHTVRYTEMAPDRFKNLWRCLTS